MYYASMIAATHDRNCAVAKTLRIMGVSYLSLMRIMIIVVVHGT